MGTPCARCWRRACAQPSAPSYQVDDRYAPARATCARCRVARTIAIATSLRLSISSRLAAAWPGVKLERLRREQRHAGVGDGPDVPIVGSTASAHDGETGQPSLEVRILPRELRGVPDVQLRGLVQLGVALLRRVCPETPAWRADAPLPVSPHHHAVGADTRDVELVRHDRPPESLVEADGLDAR